MNAFLQYGAEFKQGDLYIGSGRYYARYSQAETGLKPPREGSSASSLILEAFDAQWFDNNPPPEFPEPQPLFDYYQRAVLFVLDIQSMPELLPFVGGLSRIDGTAQEDGELEVWFSIQVAPIAPAAAPNQGAMMTVYNNLFAPGILVAVREISEVDADARTQLNRVVSTDIFPDATMSQVDVALNGLSGVNLDWSVVYDVGQGASNGFCEAPGFVRGYFDIGGGVMQNTFTFPAALQNFCFSANPPIILSHWDWDHWSSANRFPNARSATWIAPRQAVGPIHLALMTNIVNQGALLLLPNTFPAKWRGQIYLERCAGVGRNHSGISLTFSERPDGQGALMLFPGDARYSAIPSFNPSRYLSVVSPHHGADMRNALVPQCQGGNLPRLVHSFGAGNTYQHPRVITRQNHANAGWVDPILSPAASPFPVRQTADRITATGLGHVWLGWQQPANCRPLPCTNLCQLEAQQL